MSTGWSITSLTSTLASSAIRVSSPVSRSMADIAEVSRLRLSTMYSVPPVLSKSKGIVVRRSSISTFMKGCQEPSPSSMSRSLPPSGVMRAPIRTR